jgi:uncharacterized membrane protein
MKKTIWIFVFSLISLGILYGSYLLLLLSLPYLALKPGIDFLITKQLIYHIKPWKWSFYVHVFTSVFLLIPGLLQFIPFFIHRWKKAHRFLGYIYFSVLLLLSGPSALVMSFYANGGFLSKLSFVLLSITWISTTIYALIAIKKGNIEQHANFLLRSYLLTLSAISLRTYAYLMDVFGWHLHPIDEYTLLAWISWVPNLLLAELLIKSGFIQFLLKNK